MSALPEYLAFSSQEEISDTNLSDQDNCKDSKQEQNEQENWTSKDGPLGEYVASLMRDLKRQPWQPQGKEYSSNPTIMLYEEIKDFEAYIKPTDDEHFLRECIITKIETILTEKYQEFKLLVFGSFKSKLYLPNGDIDISIIFRRSPSNIQAHIFSIANLLRKSPEFVGVEAVANAKVPIVKAVHKELRIPVDISIQQISGEEAVDRVRSLLSKSSALRPLLFVLKMFLSVRGLHEVYSGGISSYSLVTMIQCFLRDHPLLMNAEIKESNNLGVLLIEWFEFYGTVFNHQNVKVTINGCRVREESGWSNDYKNRYSNHEYMSVIDPNDSLNDLARGSRKTKEILLAFRAAYNMLVIAAGIVNSSSKKPATMLGLLFTIPQALIESREQTSELAVKYASIAIESEKLRQVRPKKKEKKNASKKRAASPIDRARKKVQKYNPPSSRDESSNSDSDF